MLVSSNHRAPSEQPTSAVTSGKDRRVWPRVSASALRNVRVQLSAGDEVQLKDLSRSGARFQTETRLRPGLSVAIRFTTSDGVISVRARVVLDNASGVLRPGQFVSGRVTVGESQAALAVEKAALQRFRDSDVVFEQVGDTYEVRMLELGRADATRVEVLSGLAAGAHYVTDNSYLIKADIEKAGASHDH